MATDNPGILNWNRLEPRPRTEDFDRTLRAEVRDALWMMTRQWQFGEFQAEDTGSALFSRVHIKTAQINKMKLGTAEVRNSTADIPLEADVEKEPIAFDFLMRLEMGRYWEQLIGKKIKLTSALPPVARQTLIDDVIAEYRRTDGPVDLNFYLPAEDADHATFYSNPELWHATAAITDGRGIDGKKLYDWLVDGNDSLDFMSPGIILDAATQTIITNAKAQFIAWFDRNYAKPDSATDRAWNPSHLEYQFACSAPNPNTSSSDILVADEYYQGKLDWYAFDYEKGEVPDADLISYDETLTTDEKFTVIPSPVDFAGMPHPRWWQMEDQRVDLGDINASTSDTSKIIYSEFGLIYSNDWMIFPYTVKAGSLCEVKEVVVTDCFGQRTKVVDANEGIDDDWRRWSFFGLSTKGNNAEEADTRLFIPSVTDKLLESEPIETVNFIRDEMANMVWGIEQVIPNGLGEGVDGYETALKHVAFLKSNTTPIPFTPVDNDATIQYRVANTVPENWIPFIPVKLDASPLSRQIQLRRAAMPRYLDGETEMDRVRPRTELLRENRVEAGDGTVTWNAYHIFEEEVPRSGAIVKRTWQRTRTEDGTVVTWLGRRKKNGRGEGSSNLAFDTINDKANS